MSRLTPSPNGPRLRFGPFDRIIIRGVEYKWVETTDDGHLMSRVADPAITEDFTHEAMDQERRQPGFRVDRNWFSPGKAKARLLAGVDCLAHLPDHEQSDILFRLEFCKRFLRLEQAGETSRSDESMTDAILAIHKELAPLEVMKLPAGAPSRKGKSRLKSPKKRAGKGRTIRDAPGPKCLRTWLRRWEEAAYDPLALRKRTFRSGNYKPQITPEIRAMMFKHALRYASEPRSKKAQLHLDLVGEIETLNTNRVAAGLNVLPFPSSKAFRAEIGDLDAFDVYAGRHGIDAARRKFALVSRGPDVVRPFQRIEMDEWKTNLMVLCVKAGIWETLSPEQRAGIERKRYWCITALDAATRCIVGARIARDPTAQTALATLEMVVSDKGVFADAVGALSPWDMHGTPEEVATDGGPSFVADVFQAAVVDLGSTAEIPPGAVPSLRGREERSFRTISTQLIGRFTGQTFENVVAKGNYVPEDRASLTVDDLAFALVRYLVDIYHNRPHAGLGGETPRNAWLRLTRLYGVAPAPDRHRKRAIFGIRLSRALGSRGVRIVGLHYQSLALHAYWRKAGGRDTDVRVDPMDLGHVSVWVGDAWLTVPCVRAGFDDVRVETWLAALEDLRRRFADQAKLTMPIVLQAVRDIEKMNQAAITRAGIGATRPTDEELDRAERSLAYGFSMPEPGTPIPDAEPGTELFSDAIPTGHHDGEVPPTPSSTELKPNSSGEDDPDTEWTMED